MIRHLLQNRLQANLICWRKLSKAVHGGLGLVNKLKAHSNHNLSGVQVNFDRTDRQLAKVVRGIIYTKRILAISVVSKFIVLGRIHQFEPKIICTNQKSGQPRNVSVISINTSKP